MTTPRVITLTEHETQLWPETALSEAEATILVKNYTPQITVVPPSFLNNRQWHLTAHGWVGHLPVTAQLTLVLQPKVTLDNLFRMLEYAYDLKSFRILEGLIDCHALADFYERLAHILARRVLDRGRKGFQRAYLARQETLPYVRGQLDLRHALQRPGQVGLPCHYEDHTADIEDNHILAWTLFRIIQRGLQRPDTQAMVQQAYRALGGVTLKPISAAACLKRLYNRLNDDYQPLHTLCRFFLEQDGPGHTVGEQKMLPFLVDMARLFESFVAEWLKAHLPSPLRLQSQEKIEIDQAGNVSFQADLVIYEVQTGVVRYILDTKYKNVAGPSPDDIAKVTAYAHFKQSPEAILIYPAPHRYLDTQRHQIRVRSLTFALDGDLEEAGQGFLGSLGLAGHAPGGSNQQLRQGRKERT